MSYHEETLKLLRRLGAVESSDDGFLRSSGVDLIEAIEGKLSITVPASLREWYSREDGVRLLRFCSNDDFPLYPDEFAISEHAFDGSRVVVFMGENQGVVEWGFADDGEDARFGSTTKRRSSWSVFSVRIEPPADR